VLIEDNHLVAVGGSIRTTLDQLREAIDRGAELVLLDNMDDALLREAVRLAGGRVELEVSGGGGVTLDRLPVLAAMGVDYVSMGALMHSARAMDLSLEIENATAPPG